jgi:archaellum biogenesis protein FlaJ (TadC family)
MRYVAVLMIAIVAMSLASVSAQDAGSTPRIYDGYPAPGGTIVERQPNITVSYYDTDRINVDSVRIVVDGLDVTPLEETSIEEDGVTYHVPEVFQLSIGDHTVAVTAADMLGNEASYEWNFTVVSSINQDRETLDADTIIVYGLVIGTVSVGLASAYLYYLRRERGWTYRKFLARHPHFERNVSLAMPASVAAIILVCGIAWLSTVPDPYPYAFEYLLVAVAVAGLLWYALDAQRERRRRERYERAFAQFLFEMADAMRGGIDPTKAVIEMAKTESGILRKQIRAAADNLKVGRPFEAVMDALAEGTGSPLVKRYASLIGEASKIGGEVALVLHMAAKDMDEMIKIQQEKRRQLSMQSVTIYIAVAVLMTIVYILIDIYPTLGSIDMSILGMGDLDTSGGGAEIARANFTELKRQFFHMALINAFGAGLLIGKTVYGRVKHGLIYSLALLFVTLVVFAVGIL